MRRTYTLFYMTPLLVAMNFASCQNRQTAAFKQKKQRTPLLLQTLHKVRNLS